VEIQAGWLMHEAVDRLRSVILLSTWELIESGVTETLAHELGHHISAVAVGHNYDTMDKRRINARLLDSFHKAGFTTTSDSREEVRAEIIGRYLLGNDIPPSLRR
jgi:hypothetical protein